MGAPGALEISRRREIALSARSVLCLPGARGGRNPATSALESFQHHTGELCLVLVLSGGGV